MNSQTGPWLDVRAADLRAAGAIWWRERRSCGRCFGTRLNSDGDQKPLRQIAHGVVLSCVWKINPLSARVSRATSRDENWRKKCRPHKNDAIPFEHDW